MRVPFSSQTSNGGVVPFPRAQLAMDTSKFQPSKNIEDRRPAFDMSLKPIIRKRLEEPLEEYNKPLKKLPYSGARPSEAQMLMALATMHQLGRIQTAAAEKMPLFDPAEIEKRGGGTPAEAYWAMTRGRGMSPEEARKWIEENTGNMNPKGLPKKAGDDYDYDAAKAAGVQPDARGHMPDTYKKPNHITFSDESMYHDEDHQGGHWKQLKGDSWEFTPGPENFKHHSLEEMQEYFDKYEPNSKLVIPKGYNGS